MCARAVPERIKRRALHLSGAMFRIAVTDPIDREGIRALEEEAEAVDATTFDRERLLEEAPGFDAIIVRSGTAVDAEFLEAADRLKVVGRAGVGVDNIDLDAATERGIVVLNSPQSSTISAAEHTVGLMLSLARNIPQAYESVKSGRWEKSKYLGVELYDKTLGVFGLGRIGAEVARRAQAFDMNVVAYDPYISEDRANQMGTTLRGVDEIVEEADFMTFHVPLTDETRGMIGEEEIGRMKEGARLLNVARGGIIDEDALYWALEEGEIAGAALDVFEEEPPDDNPLLELDNLIATPHLGASTEEAQRSVAVSTARQVTRALKGEPIRSAVNVPVVSKEAMDRLGPYIMLAEKLGRFASQMLTGSIEEIQVRAAGEISREDIEPIRIAGVKGVLTPLLQEPPTFLNADIVAKNRGVRISETKGDTDNFTNLVTIEVTTSEGGKTVSGTVFGKKAFRLIEVDGYRIDAPMERTMLFTHHVDKPGVIGEVGTSMGDRGVNIAGMQVGRQEAGGKAVMLMETDGEVPDEAVEEIRAIDGVRDAHLIHL
ncbi:MAG: Glyoxylate reductase [Methanonatronarchaeales archaeon]|nr:Glyoxylate reductase [Methanonatronarchaeales archaeon]